MSSTKSSPPRRLHTKDVRISSWFREYSLQRSKSMQAGETEEEGIEQQQRMKIKTDMVSKMKAKGRLD